MLYTLLMILIKEQPQARLASHKKERTRLE